MRGAVLIALNPENCISYKCLLQVRAFCAPFGLAAYK